LGLSLS
jgi:hypothetical protein